MVDYTSICENNGIYKIEMTLYSDVEHEFKQVFDDMKTKYGKGELKILTFIQILKDLDRFNEAEEYINHYLEQLPSDHEEKILCYNLLGSIAMAQGDFETSLMLYNQVLEYQMKKSNDPKLADTHENIGDVYLKQSRIKYLIVIEIFE